MRAVWEVPYGATASVPVTVLRRAEVSEHECFAEEHGYIVTVDGFEWPVVAMWNELTLELIAPEMVTVTNTEEEVVPERCDCCCHGMNDGRPFFIRLDEEAYWCCDCGIGSPHDHEWEPGCGYESCDECDLYCPLCEQTKPQREPFWWIVPALLGSAMVACVATLFTSAWASVVARDPGLSEQIAYTGIVGSLLLAGVGVLAYYRERGSW